MLIAGLGSTLLACATTTPTPSEGEVAVVEPVFIEGRQVADLGDADGDGIANHHDACPEEIEDLDGIEDDDGCPDLLVSVEPCALSPSQSIEFDEEKGRMSEASSEQVEDLATALHLHPDLSVTVVWRAPATKAEAEAIAHNLRYHRVERARVDVAADPASDEGPTFAFVRTDDEARDCG